MPCSSCGGNKNRRAAAPPPPPPPPRVQLHVTPKRTMMVNRVTPARPFHQTRAFIHQKKQVRNFSGAVRNKTMILGIINR